MQTDKLQEWIDRLESDVIDDPEEDLIELAMSGPDIFRELIAARKLIFNVTVEVLDVMPLPTYHIDVLLPEPGMDAAIDALNNMRDMLLAYFKEQLDIPEEEVEANVRH